MILSAVVAIALGMPLMAAEPTDPPWVHRVSRARTPPPHHEETLEEFLKEDEPRHGSHKISVSLISPSTGIPTGLFMAYGRLIHPPFRVERKENQIFVNGVRVMPSLVAERKEKNRTPRKHTPEQQRLNEQMRAVQLEARKLYAEKKDGQKVVALLKSHSDIFSGIEWHGGDSEVCFKSPRMRFVECWGFVAPILPGPAEQAEREAQSAEFDKHLFEKYLSEGKFVVVDARGQFGQQGFDFSQVVHGVMQDSSLSRTEKIERLKRVTDDYSLALDIVENYTADDWIEKK